MGWEEQDRDELGRWGSGGGGPSAGARAGATREGLKTRERMDDFIHEGKALRDHEHAVANKVAVQEKIGARVAEKIGDDVSKLGKVAAFSRELRGTGYSHYSEDFAEDLTARMVDKWAGTSGDSDPHAVAVQRMAQDEFGLDDARTDHFNPRGAEWDESTAWGQQVAASHARREALTERLYQEHSEAGRAVLRSMYEETQDQLVREGIEEVTLYRGVMGDPPARGGDVEVALQPMSSFSLRRQQALDFAGNLTYDVNYVVEITVPREAILSTPKSGYGATSESEVVVLGGKYPARVYTRGNRNGIWGETGEVDNVG